MIKFIKTQDRIKGVLDKKSRNLKTVAPQAYTFFRNITPKDTGNARNKTTLSRDVIRADYPYAGRLDRGWSKQFGGQGMSRPTIRFIRNLVRKLLGR